MAPEDPVNCIWSQCWLFTFSCAVLITPRFTQSARWGFYFVVRWIMEGEENRIASWPELGNWNECMNQCFLYDEKSWIFYSTWERKTRFFLSSAMSGAGESTFCVHWLCLNDNSYQSSHVSLPPLSSSGSTLNRCEACDKHKKYEYRQLILM